MLAGYWWLATGANIELSANRPYILFGKIYSPSHGKIINHAIVVYGTQTEIFDRTTIHRSVAHFGWPGYSKVVVADTSIPGSMTTFVPET